MLAAVMTALGNLSPIISRIMSRQIALFLDLADIADLGRMFEEVCNAVIIDPLSKPVDIKILTSDSYEHISRTVYLVPDWGVDTLLFRTRGDGQIQVDLLRSEVIEFTKPGRDGDLMRAGRLFCDVAYYGSEGYKVRKTARFLEWVGCVYRTVKKNTTRHSVLDAYVGQGARLLEDKQGIRFATQ